MRLTGEAVGKGLARLDAGAERLDHVAQHRVVAMGVGLVGHREHPAGIRVLFSARYPAGCSMKARSGVDDMSEMRGPPVPVSSKRPSRPPLLDHDTSIVAARPSSKRRSITALSSAVVRSPWTRVSPHANAFRTASSLPNR